MDPDKFAWFKEVVTDAAHSAKLNSWEQTFVANMRMGMERNGAMFDPTEKQILIVKQIEEKIYASG